MKAFIKKTFYRAGIHISRAQPDSPSQAVVTLKPNGPAKERVLVSYIIEPFITPQNNDKFSGHTHFWESAQIANTFVDLGYVVDLIDYRNTSFIPLKNYALFVGARTNFERIAKLLSPECKKIVHLDTAHWAFNNHATSTRLINFIHRRNACIKGSQRFIEHNSAIEYANYATILGNAFTQNTYAYAHKPMFRVPISTCSTYAWGAGKDFQTASRNFLWFASAGALHRGLDILLELFTDMPDYHLYICGPLKKETEFVHFYRKELYVTPNIHTVGWVDVRSKEFLRLTRICCATVFPSCAEGGGGAVINCMHAGLIPIASREASVDLRSFGILLPDCSIGEIKNAVIRLATMQPDELKAKSRQSWEFARSRHTRERFAAEYKTAVETICSSGDLQIQETVFPFAPSTSLLFNSEPLESTAGEK